MLATKIGTVKLDCCVFNASGPRSGSVEALGKIGASRSGAILSKSCTKLKQNGNEMPRAIQGINLGSEVCEGSFNSEGLPNMGIDYYISEDNRKVLAAFQKPYILSLSGLSLDDNCEMLEKALKSGITCIELNLACPNVPGKPIVAYDFAGMDLVCKRVTAIMKQHSQATRTYESKSSGDGGAPKITFGVKLAPYFDMAQFREAVNIICKYPIHFITTCNTIGNALFVDTESECVSIQGKGGYGGLGGGFIKPTALANIRTISTLLEEAGKVDVKVIGVGGIATGDDAFQAILCGASAVQIGSCHWTEGPKCFDRIAGELEDIMKKKGYSRIDDFKGGLQKYVQHKAKSGLTKKRGAITDSPGSGTKEALVLGIASKDTIITLNAMILALLVAMYFDVLPRFVPPARSPWA